VRPARRNRKLGLRHAHHLVSSAFRFTLERIILLSHHELPLKNGWPRE
jgi:hypothetical protein